MTKSKGKPLAAHTTERDGNISQCFIKAHQGLAVRSCAPQSLKPAHCKFTNRNDKSKPLAVHTTERDGKRDGNIPQRFIKAWDPLLRGSGQYLCNLFIHPHRATNGNMDRIATFTHAVYS